MLEEDPRLARYENRSFPLFEALDELYQGQFAEGKLVFTSSKPLKPRGKSIDVGDSDKVLLDFSKKRPWSAAIEVGAHDGDGFGHALSDQDFPVQGLEGESLQAKEKPTSQMMVDSREQQIENNENLQHKVLARRSRQRVDYGGKCTEHTEDPQDEWMNQIEMMRIMNLNKVMVRPLQGLLLLVLVQIEDGPENLLLQSQFHALKKLCQSF